MAENIQLEQESVDRFHAAMRQLETRLHRSAPQAVTFASRRFISSVRSRTVKAKPYVPASDVVSVVEPRYGVPTGYWRVKNDVKEFGEFKSRRYPKLTWTKKRVQLDNPRKRSGLAKQAWTLAGKKLGGGAVAKSKVPMKSDPTTVRKDLAGVNPTVEITNALPYAVEALKGGSSAVSTSLEAAGRAIEHYIDRIIAKGGR